MRSTRSLRRVASTLGLSAASLVVTVFVIEIALRIAAPAENFPHWERHPVLGWRGRPCLSGVIRARGCTTEYTHNSDGLRDCERDIEKPAGVSRVLCVGDSFTWGWGVPHDAVYTRVLERLLQREHAQVEVLNAGVGGYSTVQSLLLLVERGFAYSPDIVVHQATGNDLPANGVAPARGGPWQPPYAVPDESGNARVEGIPIGSLTPLGWLKYQLPRRSRLAHVAALRLYRLRTSLARRRAEDRRPHSFPDQGDVDADFRLFASLARRMESECSARGVRFILLVDFPLSPERAAYMADECGHIEAHLVDQYLLQKEEEQGTPALIANDGHWTEAAHTWIAEYLCDEILAPSRSGD